MKKLVIDRTKWYRGKGSENSCLLNDKGEMCCLGFLSLLEGKTKEEIYDKKTPYAVEPKFANELGLVTSTLNSSVQYIFTNLNDGDYLTDEQRESRLTEEFLKIGYEVEFIN